MMPALEALAQRHVGYGVQPAHYEAVGDALLFSLSQSLDDAYTPEVAEAWSALYAELSRIMQQAAYGQAQPA